MSTFDPKTVQRELMLQSAINAQLDALVRQATATVLLLKDNRDMEVSQLRNLLAVSVASPSVEVVVNFIYYQIARNGRAWGTQVNSFGHAVVADLRGTVKELTEAAINHIQRVIGASPEVEALREAAYIRLMQLYLGYLGRAFYFAKRVNSFVNLEEVLRA